MFVRDSFAEFACGVGISFSEPLSPMSRISRGFGIMCLTIIGKVANLITDKVTDYLISWTHEFVPISAIC